MTALWFLGMVVLAVLLMDARKRLAVLERKVREAELADQGLVRRAAAIIEAPAEAPAARPSPWQAPEAEPEPQPQQPQPFPAAQAQEVARPAVEPLAEIAPVLPKAERGEAAAAPEPAPRRRAMPSVSFEDLFGRKLPIWAGGITLLVAAVLLVKYSIDAGLLSPPVRIVLGLLFGGGLIVGAELARRRADWMQDARISQSLAGAGLGSLYAATLAAANLYGLIGPGTAFAALAAITALAMGLALRFGAPSAVLGLVGGLATPAVIQAGEPNVPLLAGYIAVVVGGLTLLSRSQRWIWLGLGALIGGAGWSLLMILMGDLGTFSMLAVGLLVLLLGIGLPVLAAGERHGVALRIGAAVVAALQLALLVATGDFAPLSWGLYGLLSVTFIWLTGRTPALRQGMAVPLLAALALAGIWPDPDLALFRIIIAGIVLLYGGSALWRLWRTDGSLLEAGSIAAIAVAGYGVCHWQFYDGAPGQDGAFALLAGGFALLPALGAALGWNDARRHQDIRFALLASTAGLLVVIAAMMGLPGWSLPVSSAIVSAVLLGIAVKAEDRWLPRGAQGFLAMAVAALFATGATDTELARLVATEPHAHPVQAIARWGMATLAAALLAWRHLSVRAGVALQVVAVLLGYGLAAQILTAPWLAIASATAMLALSGAMRRQGGRLLVPALATAAGLAALWALPPFMLWLQPALVSLYGEPMLASALPALRPTLQHLLAPALIAGVAVWRLRDGLPRPGWMLAMAQIGTFAAIGVHILYKQIFALADMDAFVRLGLAERTLWQAALLGAGVLLWRALGQRHAALALIGAGLAHNLVYTLLLHDPLWSAQAVGPLPVANLLLPAFGIAFVAPLLAERITPEQAARFRRARDLLWMAVILLFAYASLRQLFSGTLLRGTAIGPAENIGWSVLAISIAIGFLLWGIRQGLRDWRIASLLLMLLAVGKVFLIDASGLEGLLRIASFLALGFSLIGIGWLYSRYMKPDNMVEPALP